MFWNHIEVRVFTYMTANDIDINDQCFSPIPRISGDEIKPRNIINISLLRLVKKLVVILWIIYLIPSNIDIDIKLLLNQRQECNQVEIKPASCRF